MKKVILLALLMPVPAFGQIVENFESGTTLSWFQSPEARWKADTAESLSGRYSLHHAFDNPDAGIDRIGLPINTLHPSEGVTRWSFLVKYGYDPSSLNNWSVFLISDTGPENMSSDGGTRGFAVGVNLTGSDDTLRLWKINDRQVTTVVTCPVNWQTDIGMSQAVNIAIERSREGIWNVSVYSISGELKGAAGGTDNELFGQEWFGIYYRYSSTKDQLLWLDDIKIEGVFHEDTEAPVITGYTLTGRNSVDITLNEEPTDEIMAAENISLDSEADSPSSILRRGNLVYNIEFPKPFLNRSENRLIFKKLCDKSGNCSQNISMVFTPVWAERGDVVISEIMPHPLPAVALPGKEYIELTNTSSFSFNLKGWSLSTESQNTVFPESFIPPSGIVILCSSQDTALFKCYGNVIGLNQFPSLTDNGRLLYISDSTGYLIHGVEYSSSWYKDDLKSDGGWSLEMIDTHFPFYDAENWKASGSKKGGTPGYANSSSQTNPDRSFYGILNVFAADSANIHIRFSEPVFNLSGKIKNIKIGEKQISSLLPDDPLCRKYTVRLDEPVKRNELYDLYISGDILDFAGNPMQKCEFRFGLAEMADRGDIMFNEILFNPLPGDPDYLELYNGSGKVIDASRLMIFSMNDATGSKSQASYVSDEERCILPGEYYAFTTDPGKVAERYTSGDPEHVFVTASMPSMPDDKGHLLLYNRELDMIDEFSYDDSMQFTLLSSAEGVSLEKTDPANSSEAANWHSASGSSGWGTPGATNSVYSEMPPTDDELTLSSTKISPDCDGYEDILMVRMNLKGNGNVVSVTVFDEAGNYIRKLVSNLLAGNQASISWDGTADDGSIVRTGIYIIFITLYDDTGKTKQWKKVCSVLR